MMDASAASPARGTATLPAARNYDLILYGLFAAALYHALWALLIGLSQPLLDEHSFRQTQTAISAYWLLRGGPWVAYETPVVGFPWSIPFEFPLYQLIVAGLAHLGVPLDPAGRIINFAFFLACLIPLWSLANTLRLSRQAFWLLATVFVACPLYVYWSRTFLIESTALFFGMSWLAIFVRFVAAPRLRCLALAIVAGTLAMLAKLTTFPAFLVLGFLVASATLFLAWRRGQSIRSQLGFAAGMLSMAVVPLAIGYAWVVYTDRTKLANIFGKSLTSSALSAWNFGTLAQRLSGKLWIETMVGRMFPDILGNWWPIAIIVITASFISRRTAIPAVLGTVGFVAPLLIFTNLHIIHTYYQNSNAVFLVFGVGIGLGAIWESISRTLAIVLLIVILSSQYQMFQTRFYPYLIADYTKDKYYQVSNVVKANTKPGSSVIAFGTDWSALVPYLSERKGVAVANWFALPLLQQLFADPQKFLGDQPLGAIVVCDGGLPTEPTRLSAIKAFVADRSVLGQGGDCRALSPQKNIASP